MRLVSVSVGLPREVSWNGKTVSTGIFKHPVAGNVHVGSLNLEGDGQADLSVHGGHYKAVYAYPAEHYGYWRSELPDQELHPGAFGENLTTEGLHEDFLTVGTRLRIGTAELVVTQPRLPCYKLGIRFGAPEMVKRFLASRRTGIYFSVAREGDLRAGLPIELISQPADSLTIADIVRLYAFDRDDRGMLERAAVLAGLPESWREYFRAQLHALPQ